MKKLLSVLLLIAIVASLFSGLVLTSEAASYSYNSGKRGQVCTSLTSAAQAYWTGSYSYASLSAMSGESLRTTLRSKITSNRSTVGYNGLKTYFPYTDCYQGDSSKVLLFYASIPTSSSWDGNANWNREHMWPDSLGGNAMEGDLHSMRPTDPKANSTRGNKKYGYANGGKECYTFDNSYHAATLAGYYGTYYEPLDSAKGDCARVILYDYVVTSSMSSPTVAFSDIQTMLDWCALDPVDTYEMQRNDICEQIEGCRNPFVDYPELAWKLFSGYTMPTNMQTPSGGTPTITYTVTANSSNTSMGTVSVSGYTITATPKAGYYVPGTYTVTSGSASVKYNGNNTFTVTPTSNCTVSINFAAKSSVTVTLSASGSTSTKTGYAGEAMTLPTPSIPSGYSFAGWTTSTVSDSTTRPATVYTSSFTPTSSCTLYALYSYSVTGPGGGSGNYVKVTSSSALTNGKYLIVYEDGNLALNGALGTLDAVKNTISVSISNNTITSSSATDAAAFTYTSSNGSFLGTGGKYLGNTANSNAISSSTSALTNTVSISNGEAVILSSGGSYLRFNAAADQMRFRYYKSSTYTGQKAVQLYKKDGASSVTHYTTGNSCSHSYTAVVTQPTCTAGGYTTYTCSKCGDTYTANATAALGHSYGSFAHDANSNPSTHSKVCSRCGSRVAEGCTFTVITSGTNVVHTCTVCNYSYTSALPTYCISFSVPDGVSAVPSQTVARGGAVVLPDADAVNGYTFCGWVVSPVATESDKTPEILSGTYTPTADTTLYALYTRQSSGIQLYTSLPFTADRPSIRSASVVISDKIDIVYNVTVPETCSDPYMVIDGPNGKATVQHDERNGSEYRFTYADITPQYLGENVSATLYATENGIVKSIAHPTYSLRQYCVNMLDGTISLKLRTLLSDLLAYGAAAQIYTEHNTDALVTDGSDIIRPTYSTFQSFSDCDVSFSGTASDDVKWKSASLTLKNSVTMNFRFYAKSIDDLKIVVSMDGRTKTFTASDFKAVDGQENNYQIAFDDIKATEFSENVSASFFCGGVQTGETIFYSVNAYICAKQNDSNTALQGLVRALYNFGKSAESFVG